MRSDDSMDDCAQAPEVGHALEPYLPVETSMANFRLVNSLKEGTPFIAVFRLGSTEPVTARRRRLADWRNSNLRRRKLNSEGINVVKAHSGTLRVSVSESQHGAT